MSQLGLYQGAQHVCWRSNVALLFLTSQWVGVYPHATDTGSQDLNKCN